MIKKEEIIKYDQPLEIIQGAQIISEDQIKQLRELEPELKHGFIHGQVFRTRTEQEVSVLSDLKFPTPDSKYWQAIREQQVHFTELVMLSYEYRKNIQEIEILKAEIMELTAIKNNSELKDYEIVKYNAKSEIKNIEIERKIFLSTNHKRTAEGRIAEIINWHEITTQLEPTLQFSKDDVNEHQLGSYLQRFINEYLVMKRQHFQNMSLPEINNLTAQLVTALKKAEELNILDKTIGKYSSQSLAMLEHDNLISRPGKRIKGQRR